MIEIVDMSPKLISPITPEGGEVLGVVKHPRDDMMGVLVRLQSGELVHVAAQVARSLPKRAAEDAAARLEALASGDQLTARLLEVVSASDLSKTDISQRAGQRPGWLPDLMQGWRGKGRRGREPSISTLQLLARGLGMSLGELLGPELLDHREEPAGSES